MLVRVLLILLATTGAAFSQSHFYGEWIMDSETDAFTDNLNIIMLTESKEYVSCGNPSSSASPLALIVKCNNNETYLYVASTRCFFTSGEYDTHGDIKYRVDKFPAKTRGFDVSNDNEALGLWENDKSIPFIKELIGNNKVIMEVTPYSESSEIVTFSLKGFDAKIKKVRQACNW